MKKPGRPPKHADSHLISLIEKYQLKHPEKKITLKDLERETGVSYNIWKQNKNIRFIINEINSPPIFTSDNGLRYTLPNAKQLVNTHYSNKTKLINAIHSSFEVINDLYDYANIGFQATKRENELKQRIVELESMITEKNRIIEKLNNEIDVLFIQSGSELKRNRLGIRSNLIELTPQNIKSLSKDIKDIEAEYEGLFD